MLKNDTLKNGTSRVGLYGSVPPPGVLDCILLYETQVQTPERGSSQVFLYERRLLLIDDITGTCHLFELNFPQDSNFQVEVRGTSRFLGSNLSRS